MSKKQDAAPEPHTMTLAEINAFLKQQQADKEAEAKAEADKEAEADKPKRGRPAKTEAAPEAQ